MRSYVSIFLTTTDYWWVVEMRRMENYLFGIVLLGALYRVLVFWIVQQLVLSLEGLGRMWKGGQLIGINWHLLGRGGLSYGRLILLMGNWRMKLWILELQLEISWVCLFLLTEKGFYSLGRLVEIFWYSKWRIITCFVFKRHVLVEFLRLLLWVRSRLLLEEVMALWAFFKSIMEEHLKQIATSFKEHCNQCLVMTLELSY